MRILSRSDVQQALTMRQAIEIIKDAFAQLSNGEATVPLRTPIAIPNHNAVTLFMPAFLSRSDALAVKIVSLHYDNPKQGMPLIHAVVNVIDASNGKPLALMEGASITALRTGAVSGAATDVLARPDAHVAAIFGAGVQGRSQLRAVAAVRPLTRVYVYDAIRPSAEKFVAEMQDQEGLPNDIRIAETSEEAVSNADVICTTTTSNTPVFDGNAVKAGTHINAIGAYTPEMQEIDPVLLTRADKIVVDAFGAALAEAGDLIIPIEKGLIQESSIYGELGEITGGKKPGRERADEITFFKSVGVAIQDASVAQAILRAAEERGLGIEVDLG